MNQFVCDVSRLWTEVPLYLKKAVFLSITISKKERMKIFIFYKKH
jgi:hypothetical protein